MIPLSLTIDNFFSHKHSEIEFSAFDSALLIGNVEGNYDISNGSGKSAIFEAILWSLFNKSRAAAIDDIIMWGENDCEVTFVFSHEDIVYKVNRTRSRVNSGSTVSLAYQTEDGVWTDISGSTARLTNAEILKRIKFDYKTFINSAYFRQNDISEFATSDPSRKKEILKSIIDISKWDEYEKEAKTKIRELRSECKLLEANSEEYDSYIENLKETKERLSSLIIDIKDKSSQRLKIEETISNLSSEYSEMKKQLDTDQWDRVTEKITESKKKLGLVEQEYLSLEKEKNKYENIVGSLQKQIEECTGKATSLEIPEDLEEQQSKANEEKVEISSMAYSAKEGLARLEGIKIVKDRCYVCKQGISEDLYRDLIKLHNEEVDQHKHRIIYSKNKMAEITKKLDRISVFSRNKKEKESFLSKVRSLEMELGVAGDYKLKIENSLVSLEQEIKGLKRAITVNKQVIESLRNDDFRSLHDQIETLKVKKTNLGISIETGNRDIGILTEKVANFESKIKEMETARKELIEKHEEVSVLEKTAKLFGKNGIQTILLDVVIQDLEETANTILASICNEPFSIFLETQRVGSDGVSMVDTLDLRVKKEGLTLNFKSLSSGEQFRISLALRIALSEISSRHGGSSLDFLLLDEIDSPLDKHGTENLFVNVIKSLEKKYKILVITHNDTLKERFENVIDVTKKDGESSVSFIAR